MVGYSFTTIIGITLLVAYIAFVIASVILFIKDGVEAKREGRRRKPPFIIMFIVSMSLTGIVVSVVALLYALVTAFMASM
jgi:amino acid transporter